MEVEIGLRRMGHPLHVSPGHFEPTLVSLKHLTGQAFSLLKMVPKLQTLSQTDLESPGVPRSLSSAVLRVLRLVPHAPRFGRALSPEDIPPGSGGACGVLAGVQDFLRKPTRVCTALQIPILIHLLGAVLASKQSLVPCAGGILRTERVRSLHYQEWRVCGVGSTGPTLGRTTWDLAIMLLKWPTRWHVLLNEITQTRVSSPLYRVSAPGIATCILPSCWRPHWERFDPLGLRAILDADRRLRRGGCVQQDPQGRARECVGFPDID